MLNADAFMSSPILQRMNRCRVVVCAGAGGVGKTTVTAALGIAAALEGKRVLCLTIDPAKRLAKSLGIDRVSSSGHVVDLSSIAEPGLEAQLTVMLIDVKSTFDDLVARHVANPEAKARLLKNRLYRYISASLAGTHAYMAMEKLLEVVESDAYDLIVLDTPPTAHALDFLDAPERLIQTIDNPAMRGLAKMFRDSEESNLGLIQRGVRRSLSAIGLIISKEFLDQIVGLVGGFAELFAGFTERAERVKKAFRSEGFAYFLITSPQSFALEQARRFAERLIGVGAERPLLIVNRIEPIPATTAQREQIAAALQRNQVNLSERAVSQVQQAVTQARDWALYERSEIEAFFQANQEQHGLFGGRVELPAFPDDVYDLPALKRVAERLTLPAEP